MKTYKEICSEARQRGFDRGCNDKANGYRNDSPLSGEWAGESINELLGDLIEIALKVAPNEDENEIVMAICDDYEEGYTEGNDYI
jgi:hypothetical protein